MKAAQSLSHDFCFFLMTMQKQNRACPYMSKNNWKKRTSSARKARPTYLVAKARSLCLTSLSSVGQATAFLDIVRLLFFSARCASDRPCARASIRGSRAVASCRVLAADSGDRVVVAVPSPLGPGSSSSCLRFFDALRTCDALLSDLVLLSLRALVRVAFGDGAWVVVTPSPRPRCRARQRNSSTTRQMGVVPRKMSYGVGSRDPSLEMANVFSIYVGPK